jgi:hypothetical protein
VYALGIVLHEMLAGTRLFPVSDVPAYFSADPYRAAPANVALLGVILALKSRAPRPALRPRRA